MKQFIGGRQRKIYTGPKGGTYYMKGGKKHYIKTKIEGGNSQPPSSQKYREPGLYFEGEKITNLKQFLSKFGINTNLSSKITLNKKTNSKIFLKNVTNNTLSNVKIPQTKKASLIRTVKNIEYIPPNVKAQNKQSPSPNVKPQNKQSPEPVLGNCSICLDELNSSNIKNPIIKLPCGHIFHLECIKQYRNQKQPPHTFFECPLCRKEILLSNFNLNYDKKVKEVELSKLSKLLEKYPNVNRNKAKKLLNYNSEFIEFVLNPKGISFNKNKFNKRLITMLQVYPNINITDINQLRQTTMDSLVARKQIQNRLQREGTSI